MSDEPRFRIGELGQRVGVSPELLRAWERRYGLLSPERTPGGLRLYSEDDEQDVREMTALIASGLSAAEAARVVLAGPRPLVPASQLVDQLDVFLTALDEPSANAALDRAFVSYDLEIVLAQVILPFLRNLGERWATAQRTVAQEHFASHVIGAKLRALTQGWGDGTGPRALLACPEREQHELGLISFGLLLRQAGWRITYFGGQTPTADLSAVVTELSPQVVVLSATHTEPLIDAAADIRALAKLAPVAIGGPGATHAIAQTLGVQLLPADLITATRTLTDNSPASSVDVEDG
jgi:DNA-binding transcriptional MerR regulator